MSNCGPDAGKVLQAGRGRGGARAAPAACTHSSPVKPIHRLPTLRPRQAGSFTICLLTLGLSLLPGGIEEAARA